MKDGLFIPEKSDDGRAQLIRVAVRCAVSFFLVLCAVACACFFDSALSSKDGIALSMIAATVFLLGAVFFGVKFIGLLLSREVSSTAETRTIARANSLSARVEGHECAIIKTAMLVAVCGTTISLCFFGENNPDFLFVKIIFCAAVCGGAAKGICDMELCREDMPFSGTRFLKNRPIVRILLNLVFLFAASAFVIAVGLTTAVVYLICLFSGLFLLIMLIKAIF